MICFCLEFFFIKGSKNFFTGKIANNINPWKSIFNFFNHETSSAKFGAWPFVKMFLYFDILTWSPNSNIRSLLSFCSSKTIYVLDFISTDFFLVVLWYVLFCYIHELYYLIYQYTQLFISKLYILFFKVLINLSTITDFPSLCVECISISLSWRMASLIYCKFYYLYWPKFCLVWN